MIYSELHMDDSNIAQGTQDIAQGADELRFGCQPYEGECAARLASLHYMLDPVRGVVRSHRDLPSFLEHYKVHGPESCYIYTGRGPSTEGMHLGHMLPFMVTRALQLTLGVRVRILLTDDEKFLFRREHSLETYQRFAESCREQIMLSGFDPALTDIYIGSQSIGMFYPTILKISDKITFNQAASTFGLGNSDSLGKIGFPAYEMAPCDPRVFGQSADNTACLIVCAWDQDPFFRLVRDCAGSLGFKKPALLHLNYLPALDGSEKMNSTPEGPLAPSAHNNTVIWLTDSTMDISRKIKRHAFSGGAMTKELQKLDGANIEVDVACRYMKFFMEDSTALNDTLTQYRTGIIGSGAVKSMCIEMLTNMLAPYRQAQMERERAEVLRDLERAMTWGNDPK